MTIRDEWTFDYYLNQHKTLLGKNPESDHHWICQSQHDHALNILQACQDLHIESIEKAAKFSEGKVRDLILHGLGRRTRTVWIGFRKIYWKIAPDRTTPLNSDDNTELSDAINSVYINIRGSLDLLANSIHEQLFPQANLTPTSIGLYDNRWQKHLNSHTFKSLLQSHSQWFHEMKERRDPAAHRIPLSFVPSVLSPSDLERRNLLVGRVNELSASKNDDLDLQQSKLDEIFAQIEDLGQFLPLFTYDQSFKPIPLYPTLPTDLAHYLEILLSGLNFLETEQSVFTAQTSCT